MKFPRVGHSLSSPVIRTVLASALQAGSATLFAILSARWLGPEDRGVVVVYLTLGSALMLIGSLGCAAAMRVLVASDEGLSSYTVRSVLRFTMCVGPAVSVLIGWPIFWFAADAPAWPYYLALSALVVGLVHNHQLREILHGAGRHVGAIFGEVVTATTQTAAICVLAATGTVSLPAVTCIVLLGVGAQALYLRGVSHLGRLDSLKGRRVSVREVQRFGRSSMFAGLGQSLAERADRIVLGVVATTAAVGVYGAAATLSQVTWLIPMAVAQVVYRKSTVARTVRSTRKIRVTALVLAVLVGVLIAVIAPWLIDVVLGPEYRSALPVFYILLVAGIVMADYYLSAAVLNGLGRFHLVSRAALIGAATLIALAFPLGYWYQEKGAAVASLVAYAIMAGLTRVHLNRLPSHEIEINTPGHRPEPGVPAATRHYDNRRNQGESNG